MIKDGDWTLVDWDKMTGRTVWGYFDGQKQHYRIDYPVEKMLDQNTEARNSQSSGWGGDWHRIASVPQNVLYDENLGLNDAMMQGDRKFVSRWLNDSDNRAWRTKDGRV